MLLGAFSTASKTSFINSIRQKLLILLLGGSSTFAYFIDRFVIVQALESCSLSPLARPDRSSGIPHTLLALASLGALRAQIRSGALTRLRAFFASFQAQALPSITTTPNSHLDQSLTRSFPTPLLGPITKSTISPVQSRAPFIPNTSTAPSLALHKLAL